MAFTIGMLDEFADAVRVVLSGVDGLDEVYLGEGLGSTASNYETTRVSRQNTDLDAQIVASQKAINWVWDATTRTLTFFRSWTDVDFVDKFIAEVGIYNGGATILNARWTVPSFWRREYFQINDVLELFITIRISISEVVTWA